MNESLFELVIKGKESPDSYEKYLELWKSSDKKKSLSEYLGVSENDVKDLEDGRSFRFIVFRAIHKKHNLDKIFPGAYIQFVNEYGLSDPILEYGWVDKFEKETKTVSIQCDDAYYGNRAVSIKLNDILQILPMKERPNIFYKAMLCKGCNICSHEVSDFTENCPFYDLFTSIKQNRLDSKSRIKEYLNLKK